ncbi:MAG TPA: hypothetical protein VK645_13345 [Chitinophagaceae bacterium]|nr:hypothetical protein [Chitinophagaceae bacterium]
MCKIAVDNYERPANGSILSADFFKEAMISSTLIRDIRMVCRISWRDAFVIFCMTRICSSLHNNDEFRMLALRGKWCQSVL